MLANLDNPFYYLENFHAVLAWVAERYVDLLTAEERQFIATFASLPPSSQALYVRMVMRKGSLFRASKLLYDEIGDPRLAIPALIQAGWVVTDPVLDLATLFEILPKPELATALQMTPAEKKLPKTEQLAALMPLHAECKPFSTWYAATDDVAYAVLNKDICDRLRLIFFGNLYQGWSEFVLSDLGIYQYEKVEFSVTSRGFTNRVDIETYLALHACRMAFQEGKAVSEVVAMLEQIHTGNSWLNSRRHRLLYQIGEQAEKQKDWALAQQIYAACLYPGARLRHIRVLEKSGQDAAALALLQQARQAPENEAEQQGILRISPRLNSKLGLAKPTVAVSLPPSEFSLQLPFPQEDYVVEYLVRDHLNRDAAPVFYVENTLINSLFGLLCWPAIFKAIPGAFFHPFHRGPADLLAADFQARRAEDFSVCMKQLHSTTYQQTIRQNYAGKFGLQSPFVFWDSISADLLDMALACIPAAHLQHCFERILQDIPSNRNGFPDLIQFWPQEQRYQMIEVKGPGDRLQDNQKRWLNFFATHDMPVSVCYLSWQNEE